MPSQSMGLWSSVGCDSFGDETYGDVKTSGGNERGCKAQGQNIRGRNVQGRIVPVPKLVLYSIYVLGHINANSSSTFTVHILKNLDLNHSISPLGPMMVVEGGYQLVSTVGGHVAR
jgi:hypothetical protein